MSESFCYWDIKLPALAGRYRASWDAASLIVNPPPRVTISTGALASKRMSLPISKCCESRCRGGGGVHVMDSCVEMDAGL